MIGTVLALGGWASAAVSLAAAVLARHALAVRLETIAEACHELRGPLAAVTLGLRPDRDGALPAARIRAIELELGRAALALDDLQAGRRTRADRVGFESIEVRELLARSAEAWRGAAELRGVELRVRWCGEAAFVRGDRIRLAQATGNLISNAIEHGAGEVVVSGRAAGGRVRLEVSDAGPGLPAPIAELIGRARSRARRGHGLRIAGTIVADHGGRIAAAPSERGARVVLELPAALPGRAGRARRA